MYIKSHKKLQHEDLALTFRRFFNYVIFSKKVGLYSIIYNFIMLN